ncbi:MAG TPA: hypothetical protein VG675_12340 [Bryobacteraceae bacterium]|nr:hypothetical protein [Bryobacteraceae bacterium]
MASEMACPYFYPVEHGACTNDPKSAMLPLGDEWVGTCHAASAGPCRPDEGMQRARCNFGYARGNCRHFPADDGPDAVRFAVAADEDGLVRIRYVLERNHHPFANGTVEYSRASGVLTDPPAADLLRRQAQAYAESYVQRKAACGA